MSNWWQAIEVQLSQDDLDEAMTFARRLAHLKASGARRAQNKLANSYWTPFEVDLYGRICEHAFSRFIGTGISYGLGDLANGRYQKPMSDVAGFEVKGVPWRSSVHFHLSNGGRIPVADSVRHPVVAVSYFLKRPGYAWVDGWLPWQDALRFPKGGRVRGDSGQLAHMVPYSGLRPAHTLRNG